MPVEALILSAAADLVPVALKLRERAKAARRNRRSCETLASCLVSIAQVAQEVTTKYEHERRESNLQSSAFSFVRDLQETMTHCDHLVGKAGSAGPVAQWFYADEFDREFNSVKQDLTLLSAISVANCSFAPGQNGTPEEAEVIENRLGALREEVRSFSFGHEQGMSYSNEQGMSYSNEQGMIHSNGQGSSQHNEHGLCQNDDQVSNAQFIDPGERFRKDRELEIGCWECHDTIADQAVTIRLIGRASRDLRDKHAAIFNGILHHRSLNHPNIIGFQRVFLSDTDLCIVTESRQGGCLATYVKENCCLEEDRARRFFQQLISAVEYLQTQNDCVSPAIMLDFIFLDRSQTVLKLCALNICEVNVSQKEDSLPYADPGQAFEADREKMEVWACGVCLYSMLFGCDHTPSVKMLFKPSMTKMLWHQVEEINFPEDHHPGDETRLLSSECQDFLARVLAINPRNRISLSEVKSHPWFTHNREVCAEERNETEGLQSEEDVQRIHDEVASEHQSFKSLEPEHKEGNIVEPRSWNYLTSKIFTHFCCGAPAVNEGFDPAHSQRYHDA